MKINFRKAISFSIVAILLAVNLVYADTVVIGDAPGTGANGRTMSQNANTQYMQNQFTGPGTLPSSSTNYGVTPIQGVSYDYSAGQAAASIDDHGTSDNGPTVKDISSPSAHMQELAASSNGTVNVIANNANAVNTKNDDSSTADQGPVSQEIAEPVANAGGSERTSSGTIVNGELITNTPSYNDGVTSLNPQSSQGNSSEMERLEGIPTYSTSNISSTIISSTNNNTNNITTTNGISINNTDKIIYQSNNDIAAKKPTVSGTAAIVVNATSRQVYFSKNGFTRLAPAALTNLVTAYLLLSYKGLDDALSVSSAAVTNLESGATTAGLKAGDTILVRDAIGAMFVKSCCDVSNVVAENVGGSIQGFVAMMNSTVRDWGCIDTNFTNPSGLNNDKQVTTVYDMAVIMDKVTSNPTLKLMLTQSNYVLPATSHRGAKNITTSNKLLIKNSGSYYNGIAASRMGYTSKAKYTMASTIDYNGSKLIAVVLKANGSQYTDMTKLLNFSKIACIEASSKGASVVNNTQMTAGAVSAGTAAVGSGLAESGLAGTVSTGDITGTWNQDGNGWYFIKADGTKANNEWVKQNGKLFCVDSSGYMITGWREMSNGKMYYFDPTNGELRYNTWVNTSTGAYYLQSDGSLAKANLGATKNIVTSVGTYTIDETGKALAKVS